MLNPPMENLMLATMEKLEDLIIEVLILLFVCLNTAMRSLDRRRIKEIMEGLRGKKVDEEISNQERKDGE
jgi:hypothetical protein